MEAISARITTWLASIGISEEQIGSILTRLNSWLGSMLEIQDRTARETFIIQELLEQPPLVPALPQGEKLVLLVGMIADAIPIPPPEGTILFASLSFFLPSFLSRFLFASMAC